MYIRLRTRGIDYSEEQAEFDIAYSIVPGNVLQIVVARACRLDNMIRSE